MYIYTRTVQKWLPTSICLQKEQISYKREIWLKLYKKTKNNNYTFLNRFSGRLKGVVQFLWSHWNSESLWNRLWKSGRFSLGKQQDIKVNLFFFVCKFWTGCWRISVRVPVEEIYPLYLSWWPLWGKIPKFWVVSRTGIDWKW